MIRINLLGHVAAKPQRRAMPELSFGGSQNAPFILTVVVALGLVATAWWWQSRRVGDLRARHLQVTADSVELADAVFLVAELEDRRAAINQKMAVIVDLKNSQSGPVLLLDQINRELADSVWLTTLTLSGGSVSIIGAALSELAITDFAQALRLSSYFADTVLDYTQDQENLDVADSVQFQISTRFVPLSEPPALEEGVANAGNGR